MTTLQTLEQRRARHAWDAVQRAKSVQAAKDYSREAKRLPLRIATAGLGHAIAFANAKCGVGKSVADDAATWVLATLKSERAASTLVPKQEDAGGQLIRKIIENDADWLRRATEEALAYLRWLSRFAEAEIAREDNQGTSGP